MVNFWWAISSFLGIWSQNINEIGRINLNAPASEQVWTATGTRPEDQKLISVPASVPGGIYSDLSDGNIFDSEIYHGYNDKETKWVGRTNWTFSRTFDANEELLTKDRIVIVCEGLDSIATIYLNDIEVGSSDNMFVRYVFDIKSSLKVGFNSLRVEFQSPVEYGQKLWDTSEYPILPECVPPEFQGECHVNYLRKMQASFSWDWGPSYPSSGIWKNIYVEAFSGAVIRDVMLFIESNKPIPDETSDTLWTVTARVYLDVNDIGFGELLFELETFKDILTTSTSQIQLKGSKPNTYADITMRVPGNYVKLWWPNGFGDHPLYNFKITFTASKYDEASVKTLRGGFRTVELIEDPMDPKNLEKGLTFYFKVNGIRIYAKGTNSIPIHVLPERATREMTEWLFLSAVEANFNMIRVWGGGIYETDAFYDFADEYGILIWEDFMFACNMYPTTKNYLASVKREVETQVKRLQYHPSVAIWATNNENEAALRGNWYGTNVSYPLYAKDYIQLYIYTVLDYVKILDPSRACLPSSPTNGKGTEAEGWIAENPYSTIYGDVHYYNYAADGWDWKHLLKTRFASEYGYQSWPHPETFKKVTEPEERHWFSDMMYYRQRHPGGQEEMRNHVKLHLPFPKDVNSSEAFDSMLYMAEITQSMSVKVQTEFYRRLKGQLYDNGEGENSGALYWQMNDVWPGASWASIETNGRWKMLHYYARNFFAQIITSVYDLPNADLSVHLISDSLEQFSGKLRIRLFGLNNMKSIFDVERDVAVAPGLAGEVAVITAQQLEACNNSISICLLYLTLPGTPDNFYFVGYPNHASFIEKPNLKVTKIVAEPDKKTFVITIETDQITPFVNLHLKNNDVYGSFSDNGFIMVEPTKTIKYASQQPLTLAFFTENLDIISLHDAIV